MPRGCPGGGWAQVELTDACINLSSDQLVLALVSSYPAANVPPEQYTFAQPVPVHFHSNAFTMADNNKELIHNDHGRITPFFVAGNTSFKYDRFARKSNLPLPPCNPPSYVLVTIITVFFYVLALTTFLLTRLLGIKVLA